MAGDFFPRTDPEIPAWSNNLRDQIVSAPAAYGIDPQRAAHYSQLHDAFVEAYARTTSPVTKTPAATFEKNRLRRLLEAAARGIARTLKGNPNVSAAQRLSLGLNPRDRGGRNPLIPEPSTAPVLAVESVKSRAVHLRLLSAESSRRGRPAQTKGATVYAFVGDEPPATPTGWRVACETLSTRVAIPLGPEVAPGEKVWFTARWKNARLQSGPASAAVFAHAGGGVGRFPGTRRAV